jgi:peptidoglycan/LPS O-acetylase OafA/YrhL
MTDIKDNSLEAMRGVACMIVVFGHCLIAFFPGYTGRYPELDSFFTMQSTPFYFLVNGAAAVTFFFVLSGFVLTYRAFNHNDATILIGSGLKRLPRFLLPVFLTVLLSWALYRFHFYDSYHSVGLLTQSKWLQSFGASACTTAELNFIGALKEALYGTLFLLQTCYNSSLWSLNYEFLGSFVAFAFAASIIVSRGFIPATFIAFVLAAWVCLSVIDNYHSFWPSSLGLPVGVLLASFFGKRRITLSLPLSLAGICVALLLCGHSDEQTNDDSLTAIFFKPYMIYIVGSVLMIACVQMNLTIKNFLSHSILTGLGRLSFSIYLLHVPIICSFGCLVYMVLSPLFSPSLTAAAAFLSSVLLTVLAAYPLSLVDQAWMRFLRSVISLKKKK